MLAFSVLQQERQDSFSGPCLLSVLSRTGKLIVLDSKTAKNYGNERELRMILELVHKGFTAVMTGCAVHYALGPVGFLALGLMTGAAGLHGFLLAQNALEVLASIDLGIEDLAGLGGHVRGKAATAFIALLAGGFDLVGVAPL